LEEKINFIERILGSGFYTGYIPFASGTFGSLVALLIYAIPGFEKPEVLIPFIILFTLYGINIGNKFEDTYGKDHPSVRLMNLLECGFPFYFFQKYFGFQY